MKERHIIGYIFALGASTLVYGISLNGAIPETSFGLIVIILTAYNIWEIYNTSQTARSSYTYLANPVVLASLYLFVINLGISNVGYWIASSFDRFHDWVNMYGQERLVAYTQVTFMGTISSVGMWVGYRSKIAQYCSNIAKNSKLIRSVIRKSFRPRWWLVWSAFILGIIAWLISFEIGVGFYGDAVSWRNDIIVYLSMFKSLVYIPIIFTSIKWANSRRWYDFILLCVSILIPSALALLSGFKGDMIIPFLVAAMTLVVVGQNIPVRTIVISFLVLLISFVIIEPVRDITANSRVSLSSAYKYALNNASVEVAGKNVAKRIADRLNVTTRAASLLKYSQNIENDGISNIPYIRRSFMSPLYAVVPRVIWSTKPVFDIGSKAYEKLTGRTGNSMATSPVLPLYWAGGLIGCFVGFFLVGILQAIVATYLHHFGVGGLIVYFSLLLPVVAVSGSYFPLFVKVIRFYVLGLILQYVLIRR
ncbi:hypothetical protein GGP79_001120 [Salinibacter ruber]|uniref:hypothetical protein n=1 Tax=Salinibacter ruber TaxID=146919 RepID=UPI002169E21D|nr:hypothetical protein [Salinibacter ruber]MCS3753175.1 hypothetical protein [Salinibacter ruber]